MAPQIDPNPGEKLVLEEDCSEVKLGSGILSLTNQRIIFEKTEGNLTTLNKKMGNVLLNTTLDRVSKVNSEGFILTKVVVEISDSKYKFSVFSSQKWAKEIETQKELFKKQ
ncbi:MAG: hypothetical protein E6L04_06915 [Thaumarchaeota archaeon]|jgi:hypothetical protein|nr:MAG: hypothetical protein E6L04_06915 [Nitrososphaerota archaeon]TLX89038.1 MAG: hypothetical protein E6K97_05930 [Nitrososphaerota archaeon]